MQKLSHEKEDAQIIALVVYIIEEYLLIDFIPFD